MTDQRDVVRLEGVRKAYGDGAPAVDDLSFSVRQGSITGFLGPNGAGKTSTLRMILGLVKPDAGRISVFGADPGGRERQRIGFLPEERGLYRKMTAWRAIAFFGRLNGLSPGVARRRAFELLEARGLGDAATKKIKALSKGMAQKVQILASLAHEPDLVILDEPFSGLDPVNQQELEDFVRAQSERGATVVFSTHVMEHAERLCDAIVLIAKGRKVFDGSVDDALAQAPRRVILETETGTDMAGVLSGLPIVLTPIGHDRSRDGKGPVGERWRVDLEQGASAQDVLKAAIGAGVALRSFEPTRPHLHDAFVRLVTEAGGLVDPHDAAAIAGDQHRGRVGA